MFSLQWNIENIIAPLFVSVVATILAEVFVHSVEHLKKPHFFVDFLIFSSNITKSSARALVHPTFLKVGFFVFIQHCHRRYILLHLPDRSPQNQ